VETLRRTRVGPFRAEDTLGLEADAATAQARLLPVEAALAELPRVNLPAPDAARLAQGQWVALRGGDAPAGGEEVAVFDAAGRLVAVGTVERGRLRPVKVLGG
jgi:tRNA pseudouridine55 synthase